MNTRQSSQIADQEILQLISEDKIQGWGYLYDKYAPAIYGPICKLIKDQKKSEKIFHEPFLELNKKHVLSKGENRVYLTFLKFTYSFAFSKLNEDKPTTIEYELLKLNLSSLLSPSI